MNTMMAERERFEACRKAEGKKLLVCNAVDPVHGTSVWSGDMALPLLKAMAWAADTLGADRCLLLAGQSEAERFTAVAAGDGRVTVQPVQIDYGMPFADPTAVGRFLNGEKGYPCMAKPFNTPEGELVCVFRPSVLVQLSGACPDVRELRVHVGAKSAVVPMKAGSSWLEVAAAAGQAESRGAILGFPQLEVLGRQELEAPVPLWELDCDEVHFFGKDVCILSELLEMMTLCSKQSCGRCIFCREGTLQLALRIQDIQNGKGTQEILDQMRALAEQMSHQVICNLGSSAANLILTAFARFGEEIEEHVTAKNCQAMACKKFYTYHILADKCIGCGDCLDACDDEAIDGKPRFIHVISKMDCTKCGACAPVCPEGAIVKAGKIKPPGPVRPIPVRAKP